MPAVEMNRDRPRAPRKPAGAPPPPPEPPDGVQAAGEPPYPFQTYVEEPFDPTVQDPPPDDATPTQGTLFGDG